MDLVGSISYTIHQYSTVNLALKGNYFYAQESSCLLTATSLHRKGKVRELIVGPDNVVACRVYTAELQSPRFNPEIGLLSVWSRVHVPHMYVWICPGFS